MNIAERDADVRRSLYSLFLRPLLFRLDPERAHDLATAGLRLVARTPGGPATVGRLFGSPLAPALEQTVAGLRFALPVGLAAGFDKRGDLYGVLARMGFGFVEVGTFTREPQAGNPKPRLFRLARERALVNRLGFNNPGAAVAARNLIRGAAARPMPLGVSVGRSRKVSPEEAAEDQAAAMRELGDVADYWTLNVSSPNTPGLRAQQSADELRRLVRAARAVAPSRPLFLKLAPDFEDAAFDALVEETADLPVDGLVLTNTTVGREDLRTVASLEGGLSGAPLFERSTELVRRARQRAGAKLAIIASGGVFGAGDALAKIRAGANLVQVYTGYVFEGPSLPRRVHRQLELRCRAEGCTIGDLVGSQTRSERRAS